MDKKDEVKVIKLPLMGAPMQVGKFINKYSSWTKAERAAWKRGKKENPKDIY